MIAFFLFCAINFSAPQPVPLELQQIYQRSFQCAFDQKMTAPARVPLSQINHYFPTSLNIWPVIDAKEEAVLFKVEKWSRQGIQPGLLLPPIEEVFKSSALREKLVEAVQQGALPISRLVNMTHQEQDAKRFGWCMLGMCPASWFLEKGPSSEVLLLDKGFYLSSPYFNGNKELPLPQRQFKYQQQEILPLFKRLPDGGGTIALISASDYGQFFRPTLFWKWTWLGFDFKQSGNVVKSSVLGELGFRFAQFSVKTWWKLIEIFGRQDVIAWVSAHLSWLVIVFSLFNILILLGLSLGIQRVFSSNEKQA